MIMSKRNKTFFVLLIISLLVIMALQITLLTLRISEMINRSEEAVQSNDSNKTTPSAEETAIQSLKVEIKELAKQLMEVEQTVEKNASVEIQLLKVEIKELALQLVEVKQTAENNRKELSKIYFYICQILLYVHT